MSPRQSKNNKNNIKYNSKSPVGTPKPCRGNDDNGCTKYTYIQSYKCRGKVKLGIIAGLYLLFSVAVLRTRLYTVVVGPFYNEHNHYSNISISSEYDDDDFLHNRRFRNLPLVGSNSEAKGLLAFDIIQLSVQAKQIRLEEIFQSIVSLVNKTDNLNHDMGFTYSPNSDPANSYVIMKSDDLNNVNMNNNNIQKAVNSIISSFELNVDYALNPHSKNKRKDETYIQRIINRNSEIANAKRREAIIEATLHSWNGYKTFALGHDDFRPQTKTPNNWNNEPGQENGVGMTLIDAVTTLQVMGLDDEVAIALDYIRDKLHFSVDVVLTVFEANIRLLGGLLSIYELTGEKHKFILDRAKELGDILLKSFDTSSGIPHGSINLKSGDHFYQPWDGGSSGLAEIGTLQLEFRTLSYHTKDPIYDMKVTHITSILDARAPSDYMCPIRIHGSTTEWMSDRVNMGAMGDSFFEYLIKQYVLTNNTEERYANMSRKMISGVSKLLFRSKSKWLYIAQYTPNSFIHKMDHVTCFMGGNIALSSQELPDLTDGEREDMLKAAGELTETCVQFYKKQKTGLSPEIVGFGRKKEFGVDTSHYILRPETVESLFYMWRYTRDQKWRDYGWDIFRAIDKYCRVESGGYAGARDVNLVPPELDNTMPSFWLAETMKYMYLLFADDSVLDLRQWVFNTEAHPLRRRTRDPMDLWRQYETEHGHVPWFPPPVSGVVPIETEIMTKMRIKRHR